MYQFICAVLGPLCSLRPCISQIQGHKEHKGPQRAQRAIQVGCSASNKLQEPKSNPLPILILSLYLINETPGLHPAVDSECPIATGTGYFSQRFCDPSQNQKVRK